jgi:hypothetical protein
VSGAIERAAQPAAYPIPDLPAELLLRYEVDAASGCWLWAGYRDCKGYGRVHFQGHSYTAHRAVYVKHVGPIPDGYVLDHLCRVTSCVNPNHLDPVTTRVNLGRGVGPTSVRITARLDGTCINGHDVEKVGLHRQGRGWTCAQCGRDRVRRYKDRNHDLVNSRLRASRRAKSVSA